MCMLYRVRTEFTPISVWDYKWKKISDGGRNHGYLSWGGVRSNFMKYLRFFAKKTYNFDQYQTGFPFLIFPKICKSRWSQKEPPTSLQANVKFPSFSRVQKSAEKQKKTKKIWFLLKQYCFDRKKYKYFKNTLLPLRI